MPSAPWSEAASGGGSRGTGVPAVPAWNYVASGERLSADQEKALAARAQAGDGRARERMVEANVPLVFSIVRRYRSPRLELEDLMQEGMIGLCTAIDRFDVGKPFRFSTYATFWIRQRVLRALDRQGRLIRVPVDVAYAARKAAGLREELAETLGREPTTVELAEACGISGGRLEAVLTCLEDPLSLDAPVADEADPLTLDVPDADAPDPVREVLSAEQRAELSEALEALSSRDRLVLEARFGLNGRSLSLADLAERLRVSREAVRQIQRRALLKLQRSWVSRQ
jgi:RNA polymerase primary sigma factor